MGLIYDNSNNTWHIIGVQVESNLIKKKSILYFKSNFLSAFTLIYYMIYDFFLFNDHNLMSIYSSKM